MARRNRLSLSSSRRDTFVISPARGASMSRVSRYEPAYNFRLPAQPRNRFSYVKLNFVEDNRLWDPGRSSGQSVRKLARAGLQVNGLPAKVSVSQSPIKGRSRLLSPPMSLVFAAPRRVITCIRRQTRRRVLFARGVSGSGRMLKRPVWNELSNVRCV